MKKFIMLVWLISSSSALICQNKKNISKPNFILVMADDLGWGDVGFNGNKEIRTPEIDQMATNSLQFTRFYAAAPVCSPTRGSILTGRHPERYGIYFANVGFMKPQELTIAEVLKSEGYSTGHFGKWHLGTLSRNLTDTNQRAKRQNEMYSPPWVNGFDICFSTFSQMPTWDPMKNQFVKQNYMDEEGKIVTDNLEGDDSRIIMDRVIPFIQKSSAEKKPFFALVWFHAPHHPVIAGPEYKKMYQRFDENKQHYYGAITAMDEQIGSLRKELRRLGIEQNTVLFFTSDNGPASPSEEAQGDLANRLQGNAGLFRGRKTSLYEGGLREPSLLEWPAIIKTHAETDYMACTTDYYPTIMDILNIKSERQPQPLDGISFLNVIKGKLKTRQQPIAFYSLTQQALTDNRYKIYSGNEGKTFELYDLEKDPYEKKDIANDHSEIVKAMSKTLREWISSCRRSEAGSDYKF
jgi:arylsulfatase A-like enzyme